MSEAERDDRTMYEEVVAWDVATGGAASMELRVECMVEEWAELFEAMEEGDRHHIAKEVADLVWTALALARGYELPMDAVWAEVARSNFAKIGADGEIVRREDGKIIKPPGWTPPDLIPIVYPRLSAREHETMRHG